jgi:hypothetical protein
MKYQSLSHSINYNKLYNSYSLINSINSDEIFNTIFNQKDISIKTFEDILSVLKKNKSSGDLSDIKQINYLSFKRHLNVMDNFLKLLDDYVQTLIVY